MTSQMKRVHRVIISHVSWIISHTERLTVTSLLQVSLVNMSCYNFAGQMGKVSYYLIAGEMGKTNYLIGGLK